MKTTSFKVPDDLDTKIDEWVEAHPRMNRSDCIILALRAFLDSIQSNSLNAEKING